jgi:hypothetical protein
MADICKMPTRYMSISGAPLSESDPLQSLVSMLLGSQPSEPHAADPTATLGKWIWQAAHAVAHLSPRTRAPASPRRHRLPKFQSRAEGRIHCRAIAVLAESRAASSLPSRRHPRRERRRAVLAERLSVLAERPSSPSGHPLPSTAPWPSLVERRAVSVLEAAGLQASSSTSASFLEANWELPDYPKQEVGSFQEEPDTSALPQCLRQLVVQPMKVKK